MGGGGLATSLGGAPRPKDPVGIITSDRKDDSARKAREKFVCALRKREQHTASHNIMSSAPGEVKCAVVGGGLVMFYTIVKYLIGFVICTH